MELTKTCPACGERNPATEVICRVCMANLSSVAPSSEPAVPEPSLPEPSAPVPVTDSGDTMIAPLERLTLSLPAGVVVSVRSGHVLGRRGDAGEDAGKVFENFRTVSRRHARVTFVNGTWNIEDMESTNGTWVNGRRIEAHERCPLNDGDTVALSLACEMKVLR
jgi:pSer/pThr/pTyr-binding forkhead associated (FHA) protein